MKINNWALEDRPIYKAQNGALQKMTVVELISLIINTGKEENNSVQTAMQLYTDAGKDLSRIKNMSVKQLSRIRGIGPVTAVRLRVALELGQRLNDPVEYQNEKFTSSRIVYEHTYPFFRGLKHEEFWVLVLSRSNKLIRPVKVSEGGISGTVADPKRIFKTAINEFGSAVILAHNHPSGSSQPSEADIRLTRKMIESGKILDVPVLDHIIVGGKDNFFSFADQGYM